MKHKLIGIVCTAAVGMVCGQSVERPRPAGWENLVPGARFIDRFEPSRALGPLTEACWGGDNVKPRDTRNGIEDATYSYWGGRIRRDGQGKYHIFVARWLESQPKGHMHWPNSDVCHAVADRMEGPYKPIGDIGRGHNPEAFRCADGSWCVYVIGGCYRAASLDGEWKRCAFPLIGTDGKPTGDESNFTFAEREDGSVLAVSRHGTVWISEDGLKPFVKQFDKSIYPAIRIDTFEDPVVWKDHVQYNVIVNDWLGRVAWHLVSPDGLNWKTRPGEAYTPGIAIVDTGNGLVTNNWFKYERMRVFQDEYGRAIQANFAVIDGIKWEDKGSDIHSSKNITIPLNPGRLAELLPRRDDRLWRIRIKAEPGFDPLKAVDLDSLRFGAPDVVAFGGGIRPCGSSHENEDLVVAFPAIEIADPFAKILGREKNGRLLFCDIRLDK